MIGCMECHIGKLWSGRATYLYPLNEEEALVYAHAPALVCDVCGHVEYDPLFIEVMDSLLLDTTEQVSDRLLAQSLAWSHYGPGTYRYRMI